MLASGTRNFLLGSTKLTRTRNSPTKLCQASKAITGNATAIAQRGSKRVALCHNSARTEINGATVINALPRKYASDGGTSRADNTVSKPKVYRSSPQP